MLLGVMLGILFFCCEATAEIPFVYEVEDTGVGLEAPILQSRADLPVVRELTDPFLWSDGSGRVVKFEEWRKRRSEIKAEFEYYEIGRKPGRPKEFKATFDNGILKVVMTVEGESLTLSSRVLLPEGEGPFPVIIGIGRSGRPGSLPPEIFKQRKVAVVSFDFTQVMAHTQKRGHEPFHRLYPQLKANGAYSAWSWGVSRLIDGLELVQKELPINLRRLGITGCSFAGKMALFAGAFDERIALTIAQEPGGGGAAAWRVSETLGNVEKLGSTSRAWFKEQMFQFSGQEVMRLPMDHHELMAMVAPRALLVLGNPDYAWLAEQSTYISCRAAQEVWEKFEIGERFGFSIVPEHAHCELPETQRPEVEAFTDKFLFNKNGTNTGVTIAPYHDGVIINGLIGGEQISQI